MALLHLSQKKSRTLISEKYSTVFIVSGLDSSPKKAYPPQASWMIFVGGVTRLDPIHPLIPPSSPRLLMDWEASMVVRPDQVCNQIAKARGLGFKTTFAWLYETYIIPIGSMLYMVCLPRFG